MVEAGRTYRYLQVYADLELNLSLIPTQDFPSL